MHKINLIIQFSLTNFLVTTAFGAGAFFGDPPDAHHAWAVHDQNRPQPIVVTPGAMPGGAPSDATLLFDGTAASFENWKHEKPKEKRRSDWFVENGELVCAPGAGYLLTREAFGDCQLHIEWRAPLRPKKTSQARSNSGVFLMGMVEVQVLDNFENPTYPDGAAGAVYGVMPPAANALRPAGHWQTYDIIYRRPIVRDGEVLDAGALTVLCNGVVIQDSTPLEGGGGHKKRKALDWIFPELGSLKLQDHGDPVRFRNIWVRPLRPRALDGGFDGRISEEASQEKRATIAEKIRADALGMEGMQKAFRLYESLVYAPNVVAEKEADATTKVFIEGWATVNPGDLEREKNTVLHLQKALKYMNYHKILPSDHFALPLVEAIVKAQGWSKK
jgi:hypothetical protein